MLQFLSKQSKTILFLIIEKVHRHFVNKHKNTAIISQFGVALMINPSATNFILRIHKNDTNTPNQSYQFILYISHVKYGIASIPSTFA